ncbi:MAG: hypothetical protein ACT4P5_20815 [Armatimonadota bacterium]
MRVARLGSVVLVVALLIGGFAAQAQGQDIFRIIKTLGVGYAVRTFGPQINNFINDLLQNKGVAVREQTKVVPILSVSIGIGNPTNAYVGAAQVSGPTAAVNRTEAVAQLEGDFSGVFRIKALVPVDNLKPWESLRRVNGVGVSAIIEIRI